MCVYFERGRGQLIQTMYCMHHYATFCLGLLFFSLYRDRLQIIPLIVYITGILFLFTIPFEYVEMKKKERKGLFHIIRFKKRK